MSEESFDALVAEAELGKEATDFLASDLYRCMQGMADQEMLVALDELEAISPHNTVKIYELQNRVKVARWFKQWLEELVVRGDQALAAYMQQKST